MPKNKSSARTIRPTFPLPDTLSITRGLICMKIEKCEGTTYICQAASQMFASSYIIQGIVSPKYSVRKKKIM